MRCLVLGALLALSCRNQATPEGPPAPPTPQQVAEGTRARVAREPLRWTARHSLEADYQVYVDNQRTPDGWRRRLRTIDNGREAVVIDLVEHGAAWEVLTPAHLRGSYRPFEVPLQPALHFDLLHRSRLRFPASEAGLRDEGEALVVREEIPAKLIDHLEALAESSPIGISGLARERARLLRQGVERRFDPDAGWLIHERLAALDLGFEALEWTADPTLPVSASTSPPPAPARAVMLLASCYGTDYRLPCEPDAVLFDPGSAGAIARRVPATGMTEPVAILPDRQRVIVLREDAQGRRPVLINLTSGEETVLGGEGIAWSFTTEAALDPGGERLLIGTRLLPAAPTVEYGLVALSAPEQLQPIGAPVRATDPIWLRDGSAVLLHGGDDLLRLGLDGTVSKLTEGDAVVPLDEQRVLLRRRGRWHLFDLTTRRRTRFGTGFRGDDAPAVSPDGAFLFFVRKDRFFYVGERVRIADPRDRTTLRLPPGRFQQPIWR